LKLLSLHVKSAGFFLENYKLDEKSTLNKAILLKL